MARRKKGRGTWAHACPVCSQRYEAHGVMVEGKKGALVAGAGSSEICMTCIKGMELPWWPEGRKPKECCRRNARLTTKIERETHNLCPDYTWYICQECSRTHPKYDPTKETDDDAIRRTRAARERFRATRSEHSPLRGQAGGSDQAHHQGAEQAGVR